MPITKSTTSAEIIHDFVNSDDPKFAGKSKEERRKMALGAYYSLHPEQSNESVKDKCDDSDDESDKDDSDDKKSKGKKMTKDDIMVKENIQLLIANLLEENKENVSNIVESVLLAKIVVKIEELKQELNKNNT